MRLATAAWSQPVTHARPSIGQVSRIDRLKARNANGLHGIPRKTRTPEASLQSGPDRGSGGA